jgi:hypothetical protein
MASSRFIVTLAVAAIALPIAYAMDRNSWRKIPREELVRRIRTRDWKKLHPAMKELKRRNADLRPYLPDVLEIFSSASGMGRAAGKMALREFYPEIAPEFSAFDASAPPEKRAAVLAPLLAKYGGNSRA